MKEKNKFFAQAFDWLYQHGKAIDQTDIAKKSGISKTTISRILNHGVGRPDEKTIRKINAAFGNIFNPNFLRGQSEEMFLPELTPEEPAVNINLRESSQIDPSSMVNIIIASHNVAIASKDKTIESLERELKSINESSSRELVNKEKAMAEKDESHKREVELLEKQLSDKKEQIKILREDVKSWKEEADFWKKQVELIQGQMVRQKPKDVFGSYPYPQGAAEQETGSSTV